MQEQKNQGVVSNQPETDVTLPILQRVGDDAPKGNTRKAAMQTVIDNVGRDEQDGRVRCPPCTLR